MLLEAESSTHRSVSVPLVLGHEHAEIEEEREKLSLSLSPKNTLSGSVVGLSLIEVS
jgi:hypothetical protein